MFQTALQQILVTVWLAGNPAAVTELLPQVYKATDSPCDKAATSLLEQLQPREGVKVQVECVDARTGGA